MMNILHVSNPNVYARFVGAPQLHPLVSIIHYDEVSPIRTSLNNYGVYGLFIQKNFPRNLTYGMKMFDAADASIIAVEPGQIGGKEDSGEDIHISGWVLLFSPELLHGTDLEAKIKDYPYFSFRCGTICLRYWFFLPIIKYSLCVPGSPPCDGGRSGSRSSRRPGRGSWCG